MKTLRIIIFLAVLMIFTGCGGGGGGTAPVSDTTAPKVETFYPDPAADGDVSSIEIQTNSIKVIFDEGMTASSFNLNSFTVDVSPGFGGGSVSGIVTYDNTVRTAFFVPDSALNSSWDYVVTITTAVTDNAGNNIAADYTQTITVAAAAPPGGVP